METAALYLADEHRASGNQSSADDLEAIAAIMHARAEEARPSSIRERARRHARQFVHARFGKHREPIVVKL